MKFPRADGGTVTVTRSCDPSCGPSPGPSCRAGSMPTTGPGDPSVRVSLPLTARPMIRQLSGSAVGPVPPAPFSPIKPAVNLRHAPHRRRRRPGKISQSARPE